MLAALDPEQQYHLGTRRSATARLPSIAVSARKQHLARTSGGCMFVKIPGTLGKYMYIIHVPLPFHFKHPHHQQHHRHHHRAIAVAIAFAITVIVIVSSSSSSSSSHTGLDSTMSPCHARGTLGPRRRSSVSPEALHHKKNRCNSLVRHTNLRTCNNLPKLRCHERRNYSRASSLKGKVAF